MDEHPTTKLAREIITNRRRYVSMSDRQDLARRLLALEAVVKAADRLHTVVDELCEAIDRAADDIGGSRPTRDILADLGPAADVAKAALDKLKEGR